MFCSAMEPLHDCVVSRVVSFCACHHATSSFVLFAHLAPPPHPRRSSRRMLPSGCTGTCLPRCTSNRRRVPAPTLSPLSVPRSHSTKIQSRAGSPCHRHGKPRAETGNTARETEPSSFLRHLRRDDETITSRMQQF